MATVSGQKRRLNFNDPHQVVEEVFAKASIPISTGAPTGSISTTTKSGWCLREGLAHVLTVDNGRLIPVVKQHGIPLIYDGIAPEQSCRHEEKGDGGSSEGIEADPAESMKSEPQNCFQSLCRIVAGQQLAGAAARTVWNRLRETTGQNLTPTAVLVLASQGYEEHLQKPAGLSKAKARSIIALAEAFTAGETNSESAEDDQAPRLSETFLTTAEDMKVREALVAIKGIGPWSCDMFMMFYLERPNILPIGDLGVRKGIAKLFRLHGKGKQGSLCPKKDAELIEKTLKVYEPYTSLVSYYMWKVADTKDFYNEEKKAMGGVKRSAPSSKTTTRTSPKQARTRNTIARQVTP
ncbi:MAG: hypothetical protein SGILL_009233 [Bacillariaceae sp.]